LSEVDGCALRIGFVGGVVDAVSVRGVEVMEVCEWVQRDVVAVDFRVEVFDEVRVRLRLVTRVRCFSDCTAEKRLDDAVFVLDGFCRFPVPLFQLDDSDVFVAVGVAARNHEVNASGRQRNLELDGDTGLLRDVSIIQQVRHVLQGVFPRPDFVLTGSPGALLVESGLDFIDDAVLHHVVHESLRRILVNNHFSRIHR